MLPYEKKAQKRQIIVKVAAESDPKFGKKPTERTVEELLDSGIINLNKPKGPTSHETSEFVKEILKSNKAGQSGTLDPAVTGVLPIGINGATRVLQTLLFAGKEYVCLMHVHDNVGEEKIREVCKKFTGTIKQMPPIKSAVKRQWRFRKIYYIDIIEFSENKQDVLFRVGCEAGTYIRKLCDDMGKDLGCGAHMAQLLRTKVGIFDDNSMHTLQELETAYKNYKTDEKNKNAIAEMKKIILPMESAVVHVPKIWIFDSVVPFLVHGADLMLPGISKYDSDIEIDELVAIMTLKDELVSIGKAKMNSKQIRENQKGNAVNTERVLMKENIYPKTPKTA